MTCDVVSGPKREIFDIVVRHPGSNHDNDRSAVRVRIEQSEIPGLLLGDNCSGCKHHLFILVLQPDNDAETRYSRSHIATRNVVEGPFEMWKRQFPCLQRSLQTKLETSCSSTCACANLLHWKEEEEMPTEINTSKLHDLCNPPAGEDVVITGMSGMFPDSRNIRHFRENLQDGVNLITDDERRWSINHPEIPKRGGKLLDVEKFDAGYFGVHYRQAHAMDPQIRLLLERTVEAIMDAGLHPNELEGTNTGVFVGSCLSESETTWFMKKLYPQYFQITGLTRSMIANRVSYFLKLKGTSHNIDTACSSSAFALEHAYRAMRNGYCENAIVAGTNLCLSPFYTLQFKRLGIVSLDGNCKVFDERADGYARSESIVAVLLQKSKNAKRIYARIIHSKINVDGYKPQSITFPSAEQQMVLLKEIYEEAQINPNSLTYLEAHGTGTAVGDPVELNVIDEIFCKDRQQPLLIGSVKSNVGHTEPVAGLVSIVKVLAGTERDIILPNINFKTPRKDAEVFAKNKVKVVTEPTPILDDNRIMGVNTFGFGGANCHILLDCKKRKRQPQLPDNLPRLVCCSGRTEKSVISHLNDLQLHKANYDHVALYHNIFRKDVPGDYYRGYSILSQNGDEHYRSNQIYKQQKKPLNLAFTDFGDDWLVILKHLSHLPAFAEVLQQIQKILQEKNVKLGEILNDNQKNGHHVFNKVLGTGIVQIGIAEVLKRIQLEPATVFGCGVSDLICGYFDMALTLKETILSVYYLAQFTEKCRKIEDFDNEKRELLKNLQRCLPQSKTRSQRWISPIQNQQFSPELFLNSLNSCSANHILDYLQRNSILLEIGFGQLQQHGSKYVSYVSLESCKGENGLVEFLKLLGNLYLQGQDFHLLNLYPKVEFPVNTGTPIISSLIDWQHDKDWFVYRLEDTTVKAGELVFKVCVSEDEWSFLKGHVIDGRNLFPATGYLYFVWEYVAQQFNITVSESKVIFENCRFVRALNLVEQIKHEIIVNVQKSSGRFVVIENESVLVSGTVRLVDSLDNEQFPAPSTGQKHNDSLMMQQKDIYKELRLRGYHYRDDFKRMKQATLDGRYCSIEWFDNWICFMDIMLQLSLLGRDTRLLYVPTGIKRVTIDGPKHLHAVSKLSEGDQNMPVYNYPDIGLIKSGGIEIHDLQATSISRRKQRADPVLERYEFVPNYSQNLTIAEAIRVDLQLILENIPAVRVKIIELIDDSTDESSQILSPIMLQVLEDQPMISPIITVSTKRQIEVEGVTVKDEQLTPDAECHLIVGSKLLQRRTVLDQCFSAVKPNGFILSRESCDYSVDNPENLEIVTKFHQDNEILVLIRKKIELTSSTVIEISEDNEFDWLPKLQECLNKNEHVVLVAQKQSTNGILGLTNCLRREPAGSCVKCFFIMDRTMPKFDMNNAFYKEQFAKNLAVNILKDSQWGTYRHFLLDLNRTVKKQHCFCNNLTRGDLTSLRWLEGPLHHGYRMANDQELVYIYYSALNFRDVMLATGKINDDIISSDRLVQQCLQGFEFVGRTQEGRRVMGTVAAGAMSTMVAANKDTLLTIPDEWTMEEAATVCVVYETVLMALVQVGQIQRNQTILIHAGTGGIGLAAITVALYFGCKVYTTVGTEEKREFIKKRFPQIKDHQIGNSRDTSFEQMIKKQTHGRGVDAVLNSLADEKLMASARCLAHGGKFLEIGKFDLAKNTELSLLLLEKEASFHGIMLDHLLNNTSTMRTEFMKFMKKCTESKLMQPLPRTVFEMDEVEKAYRFLASGKHVGKIVLEIRKEEEDQMAIPAPIMKPCLPRYHCDSDKVYIVTGGLGGFGLELVDWLVIRGARKIILTSRNGITTGYQAYRINFWRKRAKIQISTADITTKEGCVDLIECATKLGSVAAIFNLAVVLRDCLVENQTIETFRESFNPKAVATKYLDEVSRTLCPNLKDFVVFSSVSCGRGNGGQTNYGMANSVMERICEQRRAEGLPGLAIQWGAVGDVGLVADLQENHVELEICGTLQQRITNCLEVMDTLLTQSYPVVASMVVAEKKTGADGGVSITEAIANIIGIHDVKTVSRYATLPELGMDSMSAVEIKQTLERDFDVFITQNDLRTLTFANLEELQEAKTVDNSKTTEIVGFQLLLGYIEDEDVLKQPLIELPTNISGDNPKDCKEVILFPGLEGSGKYLTRLTKNLRIKAKCLQYPWQQPKQSVLEMAQECLSLIRPSIRKNEPFIFIAYSYGTMIALEVAQILEQEGYRGDLILIDGSPELNLVLLTKSININDRSVFETFIICHGLSIILPPQSVEQNRERLLNCSNFEERMKVVVETILPKDIPYSIDYLKQLFAAFTNRVEVLQKYQPSYNKIKSNVKLMRPIIQMLKDFKEDLGLSVLCENQIVNETYEGDHVTILDNVQMAESINDHIYRQKH